MKNNKQRIYVQGVGEVSSKNNKKELSKIRPISSKSYCKEELNLLQSIGTSTDLNLWITKAEGFIESRGGYYNYIPCYGHEYDMRGGRDIACGDMNSDGGLNVLDIVALARCVLGEDAGFEPCDQIPNGCAGDMNGDGGYNVLDIVTLVNCVLSGDCNGDICCGDDMTTDRGACCHYDRMNPAELICANNVISSECDSISDSSHYPGKSCLQCDCYTGACDNCMNTTCTPYCQDGVRWGCENGSDDCCDASSGACEMVMLEVCDNTCSNDGIYCEPPCYVPGCGCTFNCELTSNQCNDLQCGNEQWVDVNGFTCDDYSATGNISTFNCLNYGCIFENCEMTAAQACCNCGGGDTPIESNICNGGDFSDSVPDTILYQSEGVRDCDGNCINSVTLEGEFIPPGFSIPGIYDLVGNGTCQNGIDESGGDYYICGMYVNLNCEQFDYDGGDCVVDCNGVPGGGASMDPCGCCVGGSSGMVYGAACGWKSLYASCDCVSSVGPICTNANCKCQCFNDYASGWDPTGTHDTYYFSNLNDPTGYQGSCLSGAVPSDSQCDDFCCERCEMFNTNTCDDAQQTGTGHDGIWTNHPYCY